MTDPFIVYTSNIVVILGLRAMYFLLAHAFAIAAHRRAPMVAHLT